MFTSISPKSFQRERDIESQKERERERERKGDIESQKRERHREPEKERESQKEKEILGGGEREKKSLFCLKSLSETLAERTSDRMRGKTRVQGTLGHRFLLNI